MSPVKPPVILLVDDEIGIRELLSEILSDEGYRVVAAHDAESAWKAREETAPDLILLDIWLPDNDGVSLLKQWVEAGLAKAPVIMMSGHATIEAAVEATKLGAVEVLEKPIPTKNLLAAVAAALSRGGEKDVNPRLQQANFGKSPAMRALKKSLLLASANKRPAFFVCPAVGAGEFFARFLAGAGAPVVTLEREAQLEGDLNALARRAEGGLLVARLFDFANPTLQIGLAGALREARRRNTRVVVCCEKPPAELEGAAAATDAGAALLKEISSCVVRLPRLPECKDDLPAVFDLIIKTLSDDTEKAGAALSAAAREELQSQIANAEFDELLAVLRSALLCSRGKTLDAATVKTMAAKWIRLTQPPVTKELEGLYAMPFRKAREMFEREYFLRLINLTDGNIPEAAKKAGLERTYFYRKARLYQENI